MSSPLNVDLFLNVQPEFLNFYHQLGASSTPASQNLSFFLEGSLCNNVSYEVDINYLEGYNWVTATVNQNNTTDGTVDVSVDVSRFSSGIFRAKLKITAYCEDNGHDLIVESSWVSINLQIAHGNYIDIIPDNISFSHQLGSTLPPAIDVDVHSNVSWSVEILNGATEITVAPVNSSNDGVLSISLTSDADSLNVGTHYFQVRVTDGTIEKILNVSVVVSDANGFTVTPTVINLEYLRGSSVFPSAEVHVFSDEAWTATVNDARLNLSTLSGNSSSVIDVEINNITSMPTGNFQFSFNVKTANDSVLIIINLLVFDFLKTSLVEGKFHFTKTKEYIYISSNKDATYVELKFDMTIGKWDGNTEQLTRIYKLPLFKRRGEFYPGIVVNDFFDYGVHKDDYSDAVVHVLYKSLRLDLTITEKDLNTGEVYFVSNLQNIKFIKGMNDSGNLILLQKNKKRKRLIGDEIFLQTVSNVKETIVKTFNNVSNTICMPTIIDALKVLRLQIGLTNVGDEVLIGIYDNYRSICPDFIFIPGIYSIKYINIPYKNKLNIWFLNDYDSIERFVFTGKMFATSNTTRQFNSVNFHTFEKKRVALTNTVETLKINTGWIFPEEINTLQDLINSKRVWLEWNDELIELAPQTKKLKLTEWYPKLHNFDIEFNIIENTNDKIYLH